MTKTPEELTEDWKAGKLHKRFDEPKLFYCKTDNGIEILKTWGYKNLEFLSMADEVFEPVDDVQILAPVPTYDEYKAMQEQIADQRAKLESARWYQTVQNEDIGKLRGLLKDIKLFFEECNPHDLTIIADNMDIYLTRINAALNESEGK
jgi:hypothetical protein